MTKLTDLYAAAIGRLDRAGWALPLAARFVFLAVLAGYFLGSAATKFSSFPFGLSIGAYGQIFPVAFDAVGFDASALAWPYKLIALFGSWAEVVLPLAIIVGLGTRIAALGMIGFVFVQSLTDIYGHGVSPIGAWFDRDSASLIMDQRTLWVFLLLVLVMRGAGALSLDGLIANRLKR